MNTFNGDPALKQRLVDRAHDHALADRITHGIYGHFTGSHGQHWQGCAIGCLATDVAWLNEDGTRCEPEEGRKLSGGNLLGAQDGCEAVEEEFNIPARLLLFAEAVFESHPKFDDSGRASKEAADWPREFVEAIPVGVDLDEEVVQEWLVEWAESRNVYVDESDWAIPWHLDAKEFILDKLASVTPEETADDHADNVVAEIIEKTEARKAEVKSEELVK